MDTTLAPMSAALALRLLWLLLIPNTPFSDFLSDQQFARQFASGVFPQGVTFQGAGYPLALGLAFRLAGSSDPLVGKLENLLFSMATLALCAYIFWRLTPRRWFAIAATAVAALLLWLTDLAPHPQRRDPRWRSRRSSGRACEPKRAWLLVQQWSVTLSERIGAVSAWPCHSYDVRQVSGLYAVCYRLGMWRPRWAVSNPSAR